MKGSNLKKARELIITVIKDGIVSVPVGNNYSTLFNRVRQAGYEKSMSVIITVDDGIMTVKHPRYKDKV